MPLPIEFEPELERVLNRPPRVARYHGAFATQFHREGLEVSGALYDDSGSLIELSQRPSGYAGDRITLTDPGNLAPVEPAEVMAGRGCYIGHIFNHYGHFLTEGLSPLWVGSDFDYFAVHPFIFGGLLPGYARHWLSGLGFDPGRIRVIRGITKFEDITVPERAWFANKSAVSSFRGVLDRITAPFGPHRPALRIYLSRANVPLRAVPNELEIENIFSKRGFVVIHPERLNIDAQLALYGQAEILAGFSGSALHNILLCPDGIRTIALGDERAQAKPPPNQAICAALKKSRTTMVPYRAAPAGFDLEYLKEALDQAI